MSISDNLLNRCPPHPLASPQVLLDKESATYKEVLYQLKLGLQGNPCSDVQIWQVDNPQTQVTYSRRTQNMLTLDCWVDCGSLDSNNQMDDVCRRGFLFPASGEGMSYFHGNIKVGTLGLRAVTPSRSLGESAGPPFVCPGHYSAHPLRLKSAA